MLLKILTYGNKLHKIIADDTHWSPFAAKILAEEIYGKLIEFSDTLIEKHQKEICKKHKFEMTGHKLEIKGICSACR